MKKHFRVLKASLSSRSEKDNLLNFKYFQLPKLLIPFGIVHLIEFFPR
jgi:hypothetical protein